MGSVTYKIKNVDDTETIEEIRTVVVHRFKVGDVEDPDLWAGESLYFWETSEAGKFIMKHAIETPKWYRNLNVGSHSYDYSIVAKLNTKTLTEYYLKWSKNESF